MDCTDTVIFVPSISSSPLKRSSVVLKDPDGVIYVMNGPAGDQAKGESSIYKHDESLYAYALPSKISSWAEFEVSGDVLSVTVKTAQSGTAANLISWGIKKTK